MPATPPPRNAFGRFLQAQGWSHQHAAAVLGTSQATISRIAGGLQDIPPVMERLLFLLERHPQLVAELVGRWAP